MPVSVHHIGPATGSTYHEHTASNWTHHITPVTHLQRSVHRPYGFTPAVHGHRCQYLDTPYCTGHAPTAYAIDAVICSALRPAQDPRTTNIPAMTPVPISTHTENPCTTFHLTFSVCPHRKSLHNFSPDFFCTPAQKIPAQLFT